MQVKDKHSRANTHWPGEARYCRQSVRMNMMPKGRYPIGKPVSEGGRSSGASRVLTANTSLLSCLTSVFVDFTQELYCV